MFTPQERLQRCHEVLQDAFEGQPSYFEQAGNPNDWTAEIVRERKPHIGVAIRLKRDGRTLISFKAQDDRVTAMVSTYEEFASWVYGYSRLHDGQTWMTPRHFTCLVNDVFAPDPPLQPNPYHPHHQEFRIKGDIRLVFEWDTEQCRLMASLWDNAGPRYREWFQLPEDALGWLASIAGQVGHE